MSDTTLRTFLICIVAGLFVMTALYTFVASFSSEQGIQTDPAMDEVYANYTGYLKAVNSYNQGLQNSTEASQAPTDTGGEASAINKIYTTIKLPFEQVKIVQSTTTKTSEMVGIPRWAYYSLLSIVMIVIVAIFIGIVTRTGKP